MAMNYGTYSTPPMQKNRNSAISNPSSMSTAGTNNGLTNPMQSSVSKSLNIPTPTAPQGHRQIPFGGKTDTTSAMGTYNPNQGRSTVNVNENVSTIQNRGNYGMAIPRGNMQSAPPQGIYKRPRIY